MNRYEVCDQHPRYTGARAPRSKDCQACKRMFMYLQIERVLGGPDLDHVPDKDLEAGAVLLTSAIIGPNVRRIAKFLDVDEASIRVYRDNLVESGVWRGGKVCADWDHPREGGVAFILDVLVAQGLVKRRFE